MGFFEKLGEGLRKTRDSIFGSIAGLVNAGEITDELYDDLEEQLILADTGADVAMRLVEELRQEVRRKHLKTGADALEALKGIIREMLRADGEMQLSGRPAVVLVIGVLMLVYGSGRGKKGFGKVTGLVSAVYNGVTGFFSDILSYVRLMALMLSGAVLAQVFNMLGATTGNVVGFVVIALIGNALNLALNLLGCYVHDMRLQFLEFFGRFYKEGGKGYRPLSVETQYVEVMKEDN